MTDLERCLEKHHFLELSDINELGKIEKPCREDIEL